MEQRTDEWMTQGSEDWFRMRAGKITGTCFATLMTAKPNSIGKRALLERLANERITGVREPGYRSPAMIRGEEWEPEARHWYEFDRGIEVRQTPFVIHQDLPYVGISPDGIVDPKGGVQIKCPEQPAHDKFMRLARLPSQYRWQVQGELWVTRSEWWDFVSYPPTREGVVLRVLPSAEDHARLHQACVAANEEIEALVKLLREKR